MKFWKQHVSQPTELYAAVAVFVVAVSILAVVYACRVTRFFDSKDNYVGPLSV